MPGRVKIPEILVPLIIEGKERELQAAIRMRGSALSEF